MSHQPILIEGWEYNYPQASPSLQGASGLKGKIFMLLFWPGHPARISITQAHLVTVHSSSAGGIKAPGAWGPCNNLSHGSGVLYFHFGLEPNTTAQLAPHPKAVCLVPTFKWVPDVFKLIITSGVNLTHYSITLPCFMVLTACITIWNCFLGSFVYFLAPLPKLE